MTEKIAGDFMNCPEYVVTDVICTDAGSGWVRAYNYCVRGGIWVPVYMVCVPAEKMVIASRKIKDAALDIFNRRQMGGDSTSH